jgi:hypothetical protein
MIAKCILKRNRMTWFFVVVDKFKTRVATHFNTILRRPKFYKMSSKFIAFILLSYIIKIIYSSNRENIAAFYHLTVTGDGRHNNITKEQIDHMESTGLLKRLSAVYYGVIRLFL